MLDFVLKLGYARQAKAIRKLLRRTVQLFTFVVNAKHNTRRDMMSASVQSARHQAVEAASRAPAGAEKIKRIQIASFIAARQKAGMSARPVKLEVTSLRNVMKRAIDEKWILHPPTENLRPLT